MRGDYQLILTEEDFNKLVESFTINNHKLESKRPAKYPCAASVKIVGCKKFGLEIADEGCPTLLRSRLYPSDYRKLLTYLHETKQLSQVDYDKLTELSLAGVL